MSTVSKHPKFSGPHLPIGWPTVRVDGKKLALSRDLLTGMTLHAPTESVVRSIIEGNRDGRSDAEPLVGLQQVLNSIRGLPRGEERLERMNTFVRTLGQREAFATLLDLLRDAASREGSAGYELAKSSVTSAKHSVYGWCGQTKILRSDNANVKGMMAAEPGVQEILGKTPTDVWSLSMHIWHVNPKATGFKPGGRSAVGVVAEPPHSHPFDFVSMVSIGEMRQSTYAQAGINDGDSENGGSSAGLAAGRYDGITLEHVHGVWPPHLGGREQSRIRTLEDRVLLKEGDSYYMPGNVIHDVEIDKRVSATTPAISLFLRSESVVKPHVFMATAMADFHDVNPDLQQRSYPLSAAAWNRKLELVSKYLRGEITELNLDGVVNYNGNYAFIHE